MTALDLTRLKALALAATPGEWQVGDKVARFVYAATLEPICECDSIGEAKSDWANAAFIAAANPAAVLDLIARLERAEARAAAGLTVKLASMHESNGRVTWDVRLAKSDSTTLLDSHSVYTDTVKGRAEYEADSLKHFLGLGPQPDILAYETDPMPNEPLDDVLPLADERATIQSHAEEVVDFVLSLTRPAEHVEFRAVIVPPADLPDTEGSGNG